MRATIAPHIWLDDRGVPWVDDTNTKVREIVLDVLAYGWSPQEIQLNHPHLSLAQIHAALTYYYDHKTDLDREIAESETRIAELRKQAGPSLVKKKLQALSKM